MPRVGPLIFGFLIFGPVFQGAILQAIAGVKACRRTGDPGGI
jgi:hypothetical protein